MSWYIYILLCDNKTYYIGLTSNVEKRLFSHKSGRNIATKRYSEIILIYQENYLTRKDAEARARQLKGWSRAKKESLIDLNKNLLKSLSKTRSLLKSERK